MPAHLINLLSLRIKLRQLGYTRNDTLGLSNAMGPMIKPILLRVSEELDLLGGFLAYCDLGFNDKEQAMG